MGEPATGPSSILIWIGCAPAILSACVMGFVAPATHGTVLLFTWLVLVVLALFPMLALAEAAGVELRRGRASGHFVWRWSVLLLAFLVLVPLVIIAAVLILPPPIPYVWVVAHAVATVPASILAVVLTFRSMQLPRQQYSGPLFTMTWRR